VRAGAKHEPRVQCANFFPPWGAIPSRRGWRAAEKIASGARVGGSSIVAQLSPSSAGALLILHYVRQNRITQRAKSKKRREGGQRFLGRN